MVKRKIMYLIVILSLLYSECAGSSLREPLSAHHDSRLRRDISDGYYQVNGESNVTNNNNPILFQNNVHCSNKDDNYKKIEQLENKIDKLMDTTTKELQTNLEKSVQLEKKIDELMGKMKGQQTNIEKSVLLEKKIDELISETKKEQDKSALLENKIDELISKSKKEQDKSALLENKIDELISKSKKEQDKSALLENKIDELISKSKKEQDKSSLLENKIDELISKSKREQDKSALLENKIDELISKSNKEQDKRSLLENKIDELTGEIKQQQTNLKKVIKIISESNAQKNNSQTSSTSSQSVKTTGHVASATMYGLSETSDGTTYTEGVYTPPKSTDENCKKNNITNGDVKHPAFTGSSYLALAGPHYIKSFYMSMEVKATAPVTDGIIMYCAESVRGGFMSLAVRRGRLEFRFSFGDRSLTADVVIASVGGLPANKWTNIEVSLVGRVVSLKINSDAAREGRLAHDWIMNFYPTYIFFGGVDESTVLNNNTGGVSGGFKGCIKDVQMYGPGLKGGRIDIARDAIISHNVQECCNSNDE